MAAIQSAQSAGFPPRAGTGARLLTGQKSPKAAGAIRRAPDPPRLLSGGETVRGPSPRRRGGPLLPLDEGREAGILAAEIIPVSARCLSALSQLRGSFGTRDAASPAPPGSVPKVGCPVFDRAKIPRPKRRGLRGNMVPPSNRARPAVRCRTAFPQKCRDGGPGGRPHLPEWHSSSVPPGAFSLGPLQRPVLFSAAKPPRPIWAAPQVRRRRREPVCRATGVYQIKGAPAALCAVGNKREWGLESTPLGGGKKCGLWPQR